MLKELEQQIIQESENIQAQRKRRDAVLKSSQYVYLQESVNELQDKQAALLETVPVDEQSYNSLKADIIAEFKDKDLDGFGTLIGKFKEKKEVQCEKLAQILDYDEYLMVSSVTQKSLNDLCKDEKYAPIKKAIKGCVKVISRDLVDINFG